MTDNCPDSYGFAGISSTFQVAEGEVGFDLDGDEEIDNSLGSNTAIRNSINNGFDDSLANGGLLSLAELRGLSSLDAADEEFELVILGGVDTDETLDDNFDGDEEFYFAHTWVDWRTCDPIATATAEYAAGAITASADRIAFFVESFGGFLQISRVRLTASVEADTSGIKTVAETPALLGGAVSGCSLAMGDGGGFGDNAQAAVTSLGIQPDIDLDGDGLEEVVKGDAFFDPIEKCIDGDGTEIPGALCGCDPRMADGYSIAFETDLVGATILGPVPAE